MSRAVTSEPNDLLSPRTDRMGMAGSSGAAELLNGMMCAGRAGMERRTRVQRSPPKARCTRPYSPSGEVRTNTMMIGANTSHHCSSKALS